MTDGPRQATPNVVRLMAELEFLSELARVVATNSELQPILDWLVQKTTTMFGADEGSIKLLGSEADAPFVPRTIIRKEAPGFSAGSWPRDISRHVMGFLQARDEVLASPDITNDPKFLGLKGVDTRIRAVLAVPLKIENRITGMLAVTQSTPGRRWTTDEVQLLSIVAGSSAGVIEQARLRAEAMEKRRLEEEQKRHERELNLARDIQMSLLPARSLRFGPWEVLGRVVPARQVGGDAFDYFLMPGGRVALAIADVSGKGVPAALLMSNVQASLRAFCDGRLAIPDAVRQVNQSVVRSAASGKFVTMFYGEFDPAAGILHYVNAGHNFPLLRRGDGSLVELGEGGLPLGILDTADYAEGQVTIGAGDSLLLFSDGISEALDANKEEFGDERLRELWKKCGQSTPEQVIECVLQEVQNFRGRADQSDDMTLVAIGAHPGT